MQDFSIDYLKSILDYDSKINKFRWKVKKGPRIQIGQIAGYKDKNYGVIPRFLK